MNRTHPAIFNLNDANVVRQWSAKVIARWLTANQSSVQVENHRELNSPSTLNQRARMMRIRLLATALLLFASPAFAQEQVPPEIKLSTPVSLETADGKYSIRGHVEYFLVNEKRVKVPREELTEQMEIVLRVNGKKVHPVMLSRLSDDSIKRLKDWQSADWVRAHQIRRLSQRVVSMEELSTSLEEYVGSNVCLRSHIIDFDMKPSGDFKGRFSTDLISPSEARFDSSQDPRPTLGAKLAAELKEQFKANEESVPGDIFGRVIMREDKFFLMIYEINFYRSNAGFYKEYFRKGTFKKSDFRHRTLIKSFKNLDDERFLDN